MCAVLSLLARFTLLFGSPTTAMAVFLSALLGWAGLGSWISHRWRPEAPQRRIRAACLAIVPILLGYAALLPRVLPRAGELNEPWRLMACVCLLMPIGLVAGVPFPSAVHGSNITNGEPIPWMYGLNKVKLGRIGHGLLAVRFANRRSGQRRMLPAGLFSDAKRM
jgi:hypothetical protein